jgi:hypothetical protein
MRLRAGRSIERMTNYGNQFLYAGSAISKHGTGEAQRGLRAEKAKRHSPRPRPDGRLAARPIRPALVLRFRMRIVRPALGLLFLAILRRPAQERRFPQSAWSRPVPPAGGRKPRTCYRSLWK